MEKKQKPKKRYDLPVSVEALVLAAVQKLGSEATALAVFEALRPIYHDIAFPSVYTALERMTWKGYVDNKLGEPVARRGGRARKYYHLTKSGETVLKEVEEIHAQIQALPVLSTS